MEKNIASMTPRELFNRCAYLEHSNHQMRKLLDECGELLDCAWDKSPQALRRLLIGLSLPEGLSDRVPPQE